MEKKTKKWLFALGLSAAALSLVSASNPKNDIEKGVEEKLSSYKHVKYNGEYSINGYTIGEYPSSPPSPHERPTEFIEINEQNQYYQISEHFRMFEFAQRKPWEADPKYLTIDPRVIAKLEMVIDELEKRGYNEGGILLTSAFRSPWYNQNKEYKINGSKYSTHMYGLALDFLVGDVDRDGDEDMRDAQIVYTIIDDIDRSNPRFLGGAGVYPPKEEGDVPFIHIDVRGEYKRWNKDSTVRVPLKGKVSMHRFSDAIVSAEHLRAEWVEEED